MAPRNHNNFYQEQQTGVAGRMQGVTVNDTWEARVPMQHGSSESYMNNVMQENEHNPRGAFFSKGEAESYEHETIHKIAAQQTQCTITNLYDSHSCLPCAQTLPVCNETEKHNTCHYIDCLLCNTATREKIHAFRTMQRALFASNPFSPQAIYDTFYSENPF
jgi:hypothetical protein